MFIRIKRKLPLVIMILLSITVLYFLGEGVIISKTLYYPDHSLAVTCWSLFAFDPASLDKMIRITSTDPRQKLSVKITVLSQRKVRIHIKEKFYPKGSPLAIEFSPVPTIFPWVKQTSKKTCAPKIQPVLLSATNLKIGSHTPIKLVFNTPLKKKKLEEYIRADFDFRLTPKFYQHNNTKYADYSVWWIIPTFPLRQNSNYRVVIGKETPSLNGLKLGEEETLSIKTVTPLRLERTKPDAGELDFPVQGRLEACFNREIEAASFSSSLKPEGDLRVDGNCISFTPTKVFFPDRHYLLPLTVTDHYGESITFFWDFNTISLNEKFWIEVSLWLPQAVRIYRGGELLRETRASAGKSKTPTPRGTYTIYDRGYAFYSPKFNEGAYYWVRFHGPFLFHSVPFGPNQRLKKEEYNKLGRPASHGCIRLPVEEARWIYYNIPNGTKVIIHGPEPDELFKTLGHLDPLIYFQSEKDLGEFQH